MSKPRFGWRYASALGGAAAEFLVLTEDPWNRAMDDTVSVPIFRTDIKDESIVRIKVDDDLFAYCTRAATLGNEFLGDPVGACDKDVLTRVRIGVRSYLDTDRRAGKTTTEAKDPRPDWWPRQGDFHFVENPEISTDDKLYASVADNDWNSRPASSYTTGVRLTSKTKPLRARWEVPVAGSWVVSGDLYLLSYHRFEQNEPRDPYPKKMSDDEMAALAISQKRALSLK